MRLLSRVLTIVVGVFWAAVSAVFLVPVSDVVVFHRRGINPAGFGLFMVLGGGATGLVWLSNGGKAALASLLIALGLGPVVHYVFKI